MKVSLLTVGKTDIKWVAEGAGMYISRIRHYLPFEMVEIPELKNASSLSQDQIKQKEADLIMKNIHPGDFVVLLDEHGREFRSMEFSSWMEERMSRSGKDMVFVIGGAYGFADAVHERADFKISLSRMTFSHQLVRTIFVEQLYRAMTIMRGEPYHHE